MNTTFFSSANAPKIIAWAAVLLTLAHLGWLQSRPDSSLRSVQAHWANPAGALGDFKACDDFASRSGPGNVFIQLVGCPEAKPQAEAVQGFSDFREYYLSAWYYRAGYQLYPRRAFVAPADKVINTGWDLMGAPFVPDAAWLSAHDVRTVLTLGFDAAGRTLPPRWEPVPGRQTKKGGS